MESRKIEFKNKDGVKLAARLDLPVSGKAKAMALFAHCFTCNKNFFAVRNIARSLTKAGFGVLRFDFTGLGDSAGEFENTNFSSNIQDLVSAANWLRDEIQPPEIIIGHSLGGAAVIHAARKIESIQAVITIAAPSNPDHVTHLFSGEIENIKLNDTAEVNIGGRSFTIKKQFIDDLNSVSTEEAIEKLRKPLLLFHSPQDQIVGIENAREIYSAAIHPKSFVSLDGADHLLSEEKDSVYVGEVIASWAKRYLDLTNQAKTAEEGVVITRTGRTDYFTGILARNHHFAADEPKDVGGQDQAPTPYELLLSSLGACTGMTLRMYADRKKWKLEEVRVELEHSRGHAQDSDGEESKKIETLYRTITVTGKLDEGQLKKLAEIADKCPVHKTLTGNLSVETEFRT